MPRPSTGRMSRGAAKVQARLSADEIRELDEIAKLLDVSRSDVLRRGLGMVSRWMGRDG